MKRTKIQAELSAFPEVFHSLLQKGDLYDSSCSPEARVYYIDCDDGCFLKSAPKGSLQKEVELTRYFHQKGLATGYMLEILSRVKEKDDTVYDLLLKAFMAAEDAQSALCAGYLAAYGDERALLYLLRRIEDRSIGFVEFQELKYAIEALGGEYNEPRDFTADKDYIAIEAASSKTEMKS